jgi:molybdenum cofactor biosynthesis protein B
MGAVEEHRAHAPKSVKVGVITISDSRTEATDESGKILKQLLLDAGHKILFTAVVRDDGKAIAEAVEQASWTCDAIVTNGGTGLSKRDVTIETLQPEFDKVLPGFGELFRVLSYRDIGSAAMLSRAIAGVYKTRLLFCLPGSPAACLLAMKSLILPELGHAIGVMDR